MMNLTKRLLICLLCLSALFSLTACTKKKDFTVMEMTITLTNQFEFIPSISFTATYESSDEEAVLVIREKEQTIFDAAGKEDVSLLEYAELLISINKIGYEAKEKDGIVYYVYEKNGITYLVTVHRSEDCYWMVQFVCPSDKLRSTDRFFAYAKSITFDESYEEEAIA